jgi:nucleotidyltransferase substrate binding protein (TIGR01987 family)
MALSEAFARAYKKLAEIMVEQKTIIIRDAAIQRFEFTFELAWKSLRTYLKEVHGLVCNSPKSCFREGFAVELFDEETTEILLKMVDDRNETTHIYNEKRIDEIYLNVKNEYIPALKKLLNIVFEDKK